MPSKAVWKKLVKRTTQIKNVFEELNPKEQKFIDKNLDEERKEHEKGRVVTIGGITAYGEDNAFN